jgi:hypothetical protein
MHLSSQLPWKYNKKVEVQAHLGINAETLFEK